jgi:signal transduction histidine kinase
MKIGLRLYHSYNNEINVKKITIEAMRIRKSMYRQFLVYLSVMIATLLISCTIIFLYQNNTFSRFSHNVTLLEQKYSNVEDAEKSLNDSFLNEMDLKSSNIRSKIEIGKKIGTSEAEVQFWTNIEDFVDFYITQTKEGTEDLQNETTLKQIVLIRDEISNYESSINQSKLQIRKDFFVKRNVTGFAAICYLALYLITILLVVKSMTRRLGAPLKELIAAAELIITGNRDVTIKESTRADEVGLLSNAFLNMVSSFKQADQDVRHLNTELNEKNKELEQIVFVASHDLRSPLINIQGFSKELNVSFDYIRDLIDSEDNPIVLREKVFGLFHEEIPEAFHFILASSDKMDRLLNGLLRLSRFGRNAFLKKQLNMDEIVLNAVKSFEFQLNELGASLKMDHLPDSQGDGSMIDQIFSNLVGNAIKSFSPDRPGKINITGYQDIGQAVYCVADNGIGIAKQYQKQIFNLFEKIDAEKAGEGLGLTIVKKIVERHGGLIWMESEPDQGSRFFFSIPA